MNKFPRSAYVHIPFCHRRCFYCDFTVIPLGNNIESLNGFGSKTIKEYLMYLNKEILSIKHKSPLSTIYIGGGTPSILNPLQIKDLIDQVSANLFKQSGKLESRRSWLAIRNYLEQLDTEQLKSMLKDNG